MLKLIFTLLFVSQLSAETPFMMQIAEKVISQDFSTVWPGLSLKECPTILITGEGVYAFQFKGLPPGPRASGFERMKMSPHFNWNGEDAFLFNLAPLDPRDALHIFVHERFHRYQSDHFKKFEPPVGDYCDTQDPANLILSQLEEKLLVQFLRTGSTEILKDYVALHQERVRLLDPSSIEWENFQQRTEGLADYVANQTFGDNNWVLDRMEEQVKERNIMERLVKWRHYTVGATLGIALDTLQVKGWKERVEQGTSLEDELEAALPISDANARVARLKNQFRFEQLRTQCVKELSDYENDIAALFDKHMKNAGITVKLQLPSQGGVSGGGRSRKILTLMNGHILTTEDTSNSESADQKWSFQTQSLPLIIQNKKGEREFKLESTIRLHVDGQSQSMAGLHDRSFHTLSWTGTTTTFTTSLPGHLQFQNDTLSIQFD